MGIIAVFILLILCYWYHADDFLPNKSILEKQWSEMTWEERKAITAYNEKKLKKLFKNENADKLQKEYEVQQKFKNRKIK